MPLLGAVLFPVGFIMLYLLGYDLLTGVFVLGPLAWMDKRPGVTIRGVLCNGMVSTGVVMAMVAKDVPGKAIPTVLGNLLGGLVFTAIPLYVTYARAKAPRNETPRRPVEPRVSRRRGLARSVASSAASAPTAKV